MITITIASSTHSCSHSYCLQNLSTDPASDATAINLRSSFSPPFRTLFKFSSIINYGKNHECGQRFKNRIFNLGYLIQNCFKFRINGVSKVVTALFCPCLSGWAAARARAGGMQMPRAVVRVQLCECSVPLAALERPTSPPVTVVFRSVSN